MAQQEDDKASCRFDRMTQAFGLATHALLTACPQEEFMGQFSSVESEKQKKLYALYGKVVAAVHKSIQIEFETIGRERKIRELLDDLDILEEEQLEDVNTDKIPQQGLSPALLVLKEQLNAKSNEADKLRQLLQQEEEEKADLKIRLRSLHKEILRHEDKLPTFSTEAE